MINQAGLIELCSVLEKFDKEIKVFHFDTQKKLSNYIIYEETPIINGYADDKPIIYFEIKITLFTNNTVELKYIDLVNYLNENGYSTSKIINNYDDQNNTLATEISFEING